MGRNLEDVTRELLTLQTISNAMISSTYLDDILEIIVHGLEKGLNYDAGILLITDHYHQMLYPHLTHKTKFIQALEKKIEKTFSSLSIPLKEKNNLIVQSVLRKKIFSTDNIHEILHNLLNFPPDLGDQLFKETGVNKFIVVPMIIRNEVAGALLCATSTSVLTDPEIESLKNFANQAGLAIDNMQMMNRLRSTQNELSLKNERLATAYQDLRSLEELKNGLIGMVVHDLKNPLTAIRGYLELVIETLGEKPENASYSDYMKKAYDSSDDLLKMIHNLLDVSRMEEGKFHLNLTSINIFDLLKNVKDQLEIVATSQKRELILIQEAQVPLIRLDADIIQRVMANLISNAIKHTNKNGKITLSVKHEPSKSITVCVADDGEGIPKKYHDLIFEKFSQVKTEQYRNTHNVGLGLTFCKMAIENHDGRIWVESEEGQGAKFFFKLPIKE